MIFTLVGMDSDHPVFNVPLAYVQWFRPPRNVNSDINMYPTSRVLQEDGTQQGEIIELSTIAHPIQLVPQFPPRTPKEWNYNSSVEINDHGGFLINSFADKEIYQAVW